MKVWTILALVVALVAGAFWSGRQAERGDRELPVYVTGAERMLAGEEIYRRGDDAKPFTYPPFFALPFVPFAWLPEPARAPVWFGVNFALLLLVLRWLHRWAGSVGRRAKAWPFWVAVGLLAGRHVFSVFENQSHDLLILALATATAAQWCAGRGSLAGGWAGVGAACKATPLLFLELFVIRRSLAAAVLLLLAAVGCSFLPDLVTPRADGASWAVTWFEVNVRHLSVDGPASAAGAWNPHSFLNQSLSGTLTRLFSAPVTPGPFVQTGVALADLPADTLRNVRLLGMAMVVLLIGWGALSAHRKVRHAGGREILRRESGLGEVGLVLCGMVLLSPQSSKAHFCVLLLPIAFCVRRFFIGRDPVVALWLALALVTGSLSAKDIVGRELGNQILAYGSVTWCTVAVLLGTMRGIATLDRQVEEPEDTAASGPGPWSTA